MSPAKVFKKRFLGEIAGIYGRAQRQGNPILICLCSFSQISEKRDIFTSYSIRA
jgi:hypothetical protein